MQADDALFSEYLEKMSGGFHGSTWYSERAEPIIKEAEALQSLAIGRELAAFTEWCRARGYLDGRHYLLAITQEMTDALDELHQENPNEEVDVSYDVLTLGRTRLIDILETIPESDVIAIPVDFPYMTPHVIMPLESAFYTRMVLGRNVELIHEGLAWEPVERLA